MQLRTRGQVTLPKAVREKLGWMEGDRLECEVRADEAVLRRRPQADLRPVGVPAKELSRLVGFIRAGGHALKDTEEMP